MKLFEEDTLKDAAATLAGFAVGFIAMAKIPNFSYSKYVLPAIGVFVLLYGSSGDSLIHEFAEGFGLGFVAKIIEAYVGGL